MLDSGFHSEWITVGAHRILLECRYGFPCDELRFFAKVAVKLCGHMLGADARIVKVYYDDRHCTYTTTVATDNPAHAIHAENMRAPLEDVFPAGGCDMHVVVVPRGNRNSESYVHAAYLSDAAGTSLDREMTTDAVPVPPAVQSSDA